MDLSIQELEEFTKKLSTLQSRKQKLQDDIETLKRMKTDKYTQTAERKETLKNQLTEYEVYYCIVFILVFVIYSYMYRTSTKD
jgi:uncharacterized membrane protein (DUF106 family)